MLSDHQSQVALTPFCSSMSLGRCFSLPLLVCLLYSELPGSPPHIIMEDRTAGKDHAHWSEILTEIWTRATRYLEIPCRLTIDADGLICFPGLGYQLCMAGTLWLGGGHRRILGFGSLCTASGPAGCLSAGRLIIGFPPGCYAPIQPCCSLLHGPLRTECLIAGEPIEHSTGKRSEHEFFSSRTLQAQGESPEGSWSQEQTNDSPKRLLQLRDL